jgi:hypothetical protein
MGNGSDMKDVKDVAKDVIDADKRKEAGRPGKAGHDEIPIGQRSGSRRSLTAGAIGVLVVIAVGLGVYVASGSARPSVSVGVPTPALAAVVVALVTPEVVATPSLAGAPSPLGTPLSSPPASVIPTPVTTPGMSLTPLATPIPVVANTVTASGAFEGTFAGTGDCKISGQILTGQYQGAINGVPVVVQFTVFPYNGPATYPLSGSGTSRSYMTFTSGVGGTTPRLFLTTDGSVVVTAGSTGLAAVASSNLKEQKGTATEQISATNLTCT